jgi:hypothetical protein
MEYFQNEYVESGLLLLLSIYLAKLRPPLPPYIKKFFENPLFRIVFLAVFLIVAGNRSPRIALTVSFAFLFIFNVLNKQEIDTNLKYVEEYWNAPPQGAGKKI